MELLHARRAVGEEHGRPRAAGIAELALADEAAAQLDDRGLPVPRSLRGA